MVSITKQRNTERQPDPTAAEIAERSLEIQNEWSDEIRKRRQLVSEKQWSPQIVSVQNLHANFRSN